ncbi:hypothetical protein P7K49_032616 [Saguinus oedipus]|uniref:Uncharacterized protein n=1 Tax=Saguinus oedipus TaxID=9490 RepID=A0ABQ9TZN9_SAGOE|nr:hypothetical protein P7K49_032616 [Saguinus oedipus]
MALVRSEMPPSWAAGARGATVATAPTRGGSVRSEPSFQGDSHPSLRAPPSWRGPAEDIRYQGKKSKKAKHGKSSLEEEKAFARPCGSSGALESHRFSRGQSEQTELSSPKLPVGRLLPPASPLCQAFPTPLQSGRRAVSEGPGLGLLPSPSPAGQAHL